MFIFYIDLHFLLFKNTISFVSLTMGNMEGRTCIYAFFSVWNEIVWALVMVKRQFSFLGMPLPNGWSVCFHLYVWSLWCLKYMTTGFLQFIFSIWTQPPKIYYFPSHFYCSFSILHDQTCSMLSCSFGLENIGDKSRKQRIYFFTLS